MIDTDKYEGHTPAPWTFKGPQGLDLENETHSVVTLYDNPRMRTGGLVDMQLIADAPLLLEEVKRLREENETLRKMDWEYECLWTWLAENTNLLNTIEPLMEEWKKEMIE